MLGVLLALAAGDGLAAPFLARAGGQPIDVDTRAAPLWADVDSDGREDLVVGQGAGQVLWFRNLGDRAKPRLAAAGLIHGGEAPASVPPG
jgi:hypothetical protein